MKALQVEKNRSKTHETLVLLKTPVAFKRDNFSVRIPVDETGLPSKITSVHFGRLLGVTGQDWHLMRDVGKLAAACLAAALACAALRFFLPGAAPFIILSACGALFAIVYLASIYLFRIPTQDEYEQIRLAIVRYLPHSLRYRLD
jgi:hypothetical protein